MYKKRNGSKFLDDKKKLIFSSIIKKSLNNSYSKKNNIRKKNLKFANIIINMNQSQINANVNPIKEKNTKKLFNIQPHEKNISKEKDNFSPKVLSILIQGIISLKTNDILGYTIKLSEIILYIKNNNTNPNFNIYEDLYVNNEFLNMIYQTYFELFSRDTPTYQILKNDYNKDQEIFKKTHLIYIFYIFTGVNYLNSNIDSNPSNNLQILNFLKNLLEKEKCKRCFLCAEIEKVTKKKFLKKTSVLRVGKNEKYLQRNNIGNFGEIYYGNFYETEQTDINLNNNSNLFPSSQKISLIKIKDNKSANNNGLFSNVDNVHLINSHRENNNTFNYSGYFDSYKKLPNINNTVTSIGMSKSASSKKIRNKSNPKIYERRNQNMLKYLISNNNKSSVKNKKSYRILKGIFPKKLNLKNNNNDSNSK